MTDKNKKKSVIVLGGGPNRIGQGIEFDYCCCHASYAIKEEGYEAIMVNSNPETVSTDFDTSDRLYFEPLTREDIMHIIEKEKPIGVIVQFGGQTPLKLARALEDAGAPIIGTSVDSIDRAEDRKRFKAVIKKLKLNQPSNESSEGFSVCLRVASQGFTGGGKRSCRKGNKPRPKTNLGLEFVGQPVIVSASDR